MNPLARLPYGAAFGIASLASRIAPRGGGKLARSLAGRNGAAERIAAWATAKRDASRPLAWIHAPSVGEGLMAKPVIEGLRARHPHVQIAYTHFSPSAESLAHSLPVDIADYLPFDTADAARALLDALKPSVLAFSKVDVWPVLAEEAARRGVRTCLTSAALAASSGRRTRVAGAFLRDAYASLSVVGAVHEDDAERLATLGVSPSRIEITGDTRYDQVWARARGPLPAVELVDRLRADRPTLVAGSVWPADLDTLFNEWPKVTRRVPGARLIVAEHEPRHGMMLRMAVLAKPAGLSVAMLEAARPAHDIVIVDRMGVLADLYALGSVAYVGGGFHSAGLHSVVEPAAHGAAVLFGPQHTSSRDALALMKAGAGFAVHTPAQFESRLVELFTDDAARSRAGTAAKRVIESGLGAAERTLRLIEAQLAR